MAWQADRGGKPARNHAGEDAATQTAVPLVHGGRVESCVGLRVAADALTAVPAAVPAALAALPASLTAGPDRPAIERSAWTRRDLGRVVALALISGAVAAALFVTVLLLIAGWGIEHMIFVSSTAGELIDLQVL